MKRDAQQLAVDSDARELVIIACAGSGKTTTLIKRVAAKIESKAAVPSHVTVITFTVKAADEIRVRLGQTITDKQALSEVYVGTIHGFCRHALTTFLPNEFEALEVLSEIQQLSLLSAKRKEWSLAAIRPDQFEKAKGEFFRGLLATFNLIKQEQLELDKIASEHSELAVAFERYNAYLIENALADFADLILLTRRHLRETTTFRTKIKQRATWLFVDEYQDVDPVQHDLILSLAEGGKLCVIGDDDQAIYQFRGTDYRHFVSLTKPASGRDIVILDTNFRCRTNILKNAIRVIEKADGRVSKPMRAFKPGGRVFKKKFVHVHDEAQFIASEIIFLKAEGVITAYSDVAILLRSVASYGEPYIKELQRQRIPFTTRGDGSLFEHPLVKLVCRVLEFIAQEDTDIRHLQILGSPFNIITGRTDWTELSDSDWIAAGVSPSDVALLRRWESVRARYRARKFTALLEIVLDVVSSLPVLGNPTEPVVAPNIGELTQLVNEFDGVSQTKNLFLLCGFLAMHGDGIADQYFAPPDADTVSMLTAHQSKGLQFSIVFTPMLCEGRFPSDRDDTKILIKPALYDADRYRSNVGAERRLYYVAMTRAADRLYASFASNVGLVKPKRASIFFNELKHLDSAVCAKSIPSIDKRTLPLSTSYSSLELFLSCPYRYKLARSYGLMTPPNPFFEFGRVLHLVLRQVHELFISGISVSDEDVEKLYDRTFRLRLYVPKVTIEMRRAAGLKAIKSYIANKKPWLARTYMVEKEFQYVVKNSILSGRYDLILKNGEFVIIDFKTGKPHDYIDTVFQLALYALVARDYFNLNVTRAVTYYVEQGIESEQVIDNSALGSVKSKFEAAVSGIRNEEFAPTPGTVCVRCEFRKVCPYRA